MMKTITLLLISVVFSNQLSISVSDYQNSNFNVVKSYIINKNILLEQEVAQTTLLTENNDIDFSFHPNPATDKISFKSSAKISQILIFDLLGKQVKNAVVDFNNSNIDVSQLATGAYIMKVSIGVNSKNYKFIKL